MIVNLIFNMRCVVQPRNYSQKIDDFLCRSKNIYKILKLIRSTTKKIVHNIYKEYIFHLVI